MRPSLIAVLSLALGSFALGGCKQDLGERCEQGSDCSSGYCNYSALAEMTSAMGRVCTEAFPRGIDAGVDTRVSPPVMDAAPMDTASVHDAAPDAPAVDTSAADGAADGLEAGAGG